MSWCTATCRQRINAMVLMQYDLFSWNKCNIILISVISHVITPVQTSFVKNAHSVHAGPSSSRLACPSFFFLLHVASFLAGSWHLIFSTPSGAWSSLTPLPWDDPISLRSQTMLRFHVGHTYNILQLIYGPKNVKSLYLVWWTFVQGCELPPTPIPCWS